MEGDRIDSFQSRYIDFLSQKQQKLSKKDKKARKLYKPFRQLGIIILPESLNNMSTRSSNIIQADS